MHHSIIAKKPKKSDTEILGSVDFAFLSEVTTFQHVELDIIVMIVGRLDNDTYADRIFICVESTK